MMKIVLIIILANTGGARNQYSRVYFDTLDDCIKSLKETKIISVITNDNSWIGSATCGYEDPTRPGAYGKGE